MATTNKLIIGKNGINWLKAAEASFILERNIYIQENKDYPNSQRGINAEKWAKQLLNASIKVKKFIKESKKQLII